MRQIKKDLDALESALRRLNTTGETFHAFQRIKKEIESEHPGGEHPLTVSKDIVSKTKDIPGCSIRTSSPVVVVYDIQDVELPEENGIQFQEYKDVKVKPNAMVIAFATESRRSSASLLSQSFTVKAMLAFNLLIGNWGCGWFAEIWNRTIPLSWRKWKPDAKANTPKTD
jgi:hypothetical protein